MDEVMRGDTDDDGDNEAAPRPSALERASCSAPHTHPMDYADICRTVPSGHDFLVHAWCRDDASSCLGCAMRPYFLCFGCPLLSDSVLALLFALPASLASCVPSMSDSVHPLRGRRHGILNPGIVPSPTLRWVSLARIIWLGSHHIGSRARALRVAGRRGAGVCCWVGGRAGGRTGEGAPAWRVVLGFGPMLLSWPRRKMQDKNAGGRRGLALSLVRCPPPPFGRVVRKVGGRS